MNRSLISSALRTNLKQLTVVSQLIIPQCPNQSREIDRCYYFPCFVFLSFLVAVSNRKPNLIAHNNAFFRIYGFPDKQASSTSFANARHISDDATFPNAHKARPLTY